MGVNSLPKTVTRQRRDCDLNPGPSAPESSTLTTRLPRHVISQIGAYARGSRCALVCRGSSTELARQCTAIKSAAIRVVASEFIIISYWSHN